MERLLLDFVRAGLVFAPILVRVYVRRRFHDHKENHLLNQVQPQVVHCLIGPFWSVYRVLVPIKNGPENATRRRGYDWSAHRPQHCVLSDMARRFSRLRPRQDTDELLQGAQSF